MVAALVNEGDEARSALGGIVGGFVVRHRGAPYRNVGGDGKRAKERENVQRSISAPSSQVESHL